MGSEWKMQCSIFSVRLLIQRARPNEACGVYFVQVCCCVHFMVWPLLPVWSWSQIWVRLLLKLTLSWLPRLHFWQFRPPLCSSGGEQLIRALATAEQAEKHNHCDYCLRSRWYLAQKCHLQCPRSRGWSSLRSLRHTESQRKSVCHCCVASTRK